MELPRKHIAKVGRRLGGWFGFEQGEEEVNDEPDEVELFDEPLAALYAQKRNEKVLFRCPISKITYNNGLSYSSRGWHPFHAALKEYASGECRRYEGSVLYRYYEKWQPRNAGEALIGFNSPPGVLYSEPSYAFYYGPWAQNDIVETRNLIQHYGQKDNEEHGFPELNVKEHGFKLQGPVDPRKGRLEYSRLVSTYDSIKKHGYQVSRGCIRIAVLKRGEEYRYLNRGGIHRVAAMAALGYEHIPATFWRPFTIDAQEVKYWPGVRNGYWNERKARDYLSHLFDFDGLSWAREKGLAPSTMKSMVLQQEEITSSQVRSYSF